MVDNESDHIDQKCCKDEYNRKKKIFPISFGLNNKRVPLSIYAKENLIRVSTDFYVGATNVNPHNQRVTFVYGGECSVCSKIKPLERALDISSARVQLTKNTKVITDDMLENTNIMGGVYPLEYAMPEIPQVVFTHVSSPPSDMPDNPLVYTMPDNPPNNQRTAMSILCQVCSEKICACCVIL